MIANILTYVGLFVLGAGIATAIVVIAAGIGFLSGNSVI